MTRIAEEYQNELDAIIGEKRLVVRVIHNDQDLCINSDERELLGTIKAIQKRDYKTEWHYKENLCGKALMIPLDKHVSAKFTSFDKEYKELFQKRIQMIIQQYDTKLLDQDKRVFYEKVKALYFALIETQVVDFGEYKNIRDLFERVRY